MWGIKVKDGQIIGAGLNIIFDGTFDYVIPTTEQYARQIKHLELINGELRIKDGADIESLEEIHQRLQEEEEEFVGNIEEPEVKLITPVNAEG